MSKAKNPVCLLDFGKEALPLGREPEVGKFGTDQQQGGL